MRLCYSKVLATAIVVSLVLFVLTPHANANCVEGTVTATFQFSGPHAGLWKYTLEFAWDTPQGLSNVTLDCGFGACKEIACDGTFEFDSPAGQSDGEPAPCTVDYEGEFNCDGNPSIGFPDPIIKWDAIDNGCEPGATGSGTLCFYSNFGPHPDSPLPIVLIKDGQNVCNGTIMGDCPSACTVPTEHLNWGALKVIYEKTDE